MFTSLDKAIVALVMAVISIANLAFGIDLGVSPELVSGVVAAATPLLVWLVPNKAKVDTAPKA
jgi:hypothetical protein